MVFLVSIVLLKGWIHIKIGSKASRMPDETRLGAVTEDLDATLLTILVDAFNNFWLL
jgi:hypothetical protein